MPPKDKNPNQYEDDRTPDEDDDTLDEELEETFPSSDPPSTGGPGL